MSKFSVQDDFLNEIRKQKIQTAMFLMNGVKLQGVVTSFDNFSVVLNVAGHMHLVYKHAISTLIPSVPVRLREIQGSDEA